MCMGVPARVLAVNEDGTGMVDALGAYLKANFQLVPGVKVGDYVIIHAGFAISIVEEEEAKESWAVWEELLRYEAESGQVQGS
ncbi:MAG: HypC/HybG/HupF family hydrogenase formation chaperone [Clostridia bacterium]|nr:HypC/HybG/HupF family hydrogenase formation chaperone [Clostridia bacterium]